MSKLLKTIVPAMLIVALIVAELMIIVKFNQVDTDDIVLPQISAENELTVYNAQVNQLEVQSNRHTHPFEKTEVSNYLTVSGYKNVLQNDFLQIWINDESFDIRVVNMKTGYIWGGIEEEKTEDLNTRWKNLAKSVITVDYLDKQLADKTAYLAEEGVEKSYEVRDNTIHFNCSWEEIGVSLQFDLTINDAEMKLSLDDSTIVESEEFPLTGISFMPFLGSARLDEINGYFFLPDGSGALMRFVEGKDYISSYAKKVYGSDYGIESTAVMNNISDVQTRPREFMIQQPSILMPIYGVVHGVEQNAFLVEIQNGQENAVIMADAASSKVNYHYARVKYSYRECYIQPTAKNGSGVRTVQEERNQVNPCQVYSFLDGPDADYVGMACKYRANLEEQGKLQSATTDYQDIPMLLEVLATVRDMGYMGNETLLASSVSGIQNMAKELQGANVKNVKFSVDGWLKDGYGGYNLKTQTLEKDFANLSELKQLNEDLAEYDFSMLLKFDAIRMTEDQFTLKTDIATKISQQQMKSTIDNASLLFTDTYYRRNKLVRDYSLELFDWLAENELKGSVAGVGEILYSDYLRGEEVTRQEAILMQQELSAKMKESGTVSNYQTPNSYVWNSVGEASNVPTGSSQYLYFSDSVPFLQIVLHGNIHCFGDNLNHGTFDRENILRLIECGQYPAFMVTEVNNYGLRDTALYDMSSTQFSDWSQNIVSTYQEVNEALKNVINAKIMNHEVLEEGFIKVTYDNGYAIYVNYTLEDKHVDGLSVEGMNWLVAKSN